MIFYAAMSDSGSVDKSNNRDRVVAYEELTHLEKIQLMQSKLIQCIFSTREKD